jgi:hypothetical protein
MRKRVRTPIRNRSNPTNQNRTAPLANLRNLLEEIRPLDLLLRGAPRNVVREKMSKDGLRERDT